MKGGRKRVSQSDQEGGDEKEMKRGGTGEEILENEGLGEKREEETVEEEEGDDNEEEEEEEEEEEGNGERTKLADGFFEIEAIRRKRVRKDQLQYLIKWRGWPETANTWEPLENLQSCSDIIDVFEESLHSGKHGRKRKHKQGVLPHTQSKKKETSSSIATYNGTGLEVSVIDKPLLVPIDDSGIADLSASSTVTVSAREGERNGNGNNVKRSKRVKGNSSANGSKKIDETKDENDYDTKLSELKGVLSSKVANADKLAVRFQECKASKGNGPLNGLPRVGELVPSDRRTGANRRKSGSVKRFKQDSTSTGLNLTQNAIRVGYANTNADIEMVNLGLTADGLGHSPLIDDSVNVPVITKIIKPIEFSAFVLDNNQDVSITFLTLRSDGKEVMVDNQYLKANNPLLLINFYEQHLKYSPPS